MFNNYSYYKRHSDGEDNIECDEENISIESDESSTKLFIRHLSVYDSGTYELVANNGAHIKRIAVTLLVQGNIQYQNVTSV